ncbi:DNA-N1-methyladenine dioxygenase [Cellvibrio sp. BR]|jgi:alkylated DNA repair dioxygenase AlkB|uniref:alpha-ketoglutarate-dependent dioxygenase AlkB family protein n=1 Tax=Cellvibrio sp. BR TaxID=1134474 RepID=UPI000260104D|nr:alpha-ketoglutarate-dependent dioxygenase AlkB [Cellvibrio sp. BR]EIK43873.1 DNA-N1-methyladenine dioxygenase [Cellvibrio sp. BR]
MDLFEHLNSEPHNLLPYNGEVFYYGKILTQEQANYYFHALMEKIAWENDKAMIMGKEIITRRKVAWYGDAPFSYTYSGTTKTALPWINELLELKQLAETESKESYNSCLLNLYHTGEEGMTWHSDAEIALKKNGAIGSFSLGAERKFSFKHKKTKHPVAVILEHGSLLVMKGETQTHWLHSLPTTKKVFTPRINLTFRCIVQP